MGQEQGKSHKPELFVDNEAYDWNHATINLAQLRELASIPEDVQVFHKVPGHRDVLVTPEMVIRLDKQPGPDRFSTQAVGSQAG